MLRKPFRPLGPKRKNARFTNFQYWLKAFDPLDVAQACGVSRQHVFKWRRGECNPSDKIRALIVEFVSDGAIKYEDFHFKKGHPKNIALAKIGKQYRKHKLLTADERKKNEDILDWHPEQLYEEVKKVRRTKLK